MADNEPDAFTETFMVTIQAKGGSAAEYRAILSTYDITGGDKDFVSIANAAGGRVKNFSIQTDYEVALEGYATQVGNGEGFFDLQNTAVTADPLSVAVDHERVEYMLAIMHTTSAADQSAIAVSPANARALRDVFKNGHFTMVNQSFTDGICKFSLKFKAAPFNKGTNAAPATANVTFESTTGETGDELPAVTYS